MAGRRMMALMVASCAVACAARSTLTVTPDVRKASYADSTLFTDLRTAIGGVGFADEVSFPNATERRVVKIEALVPYDNQKEGVERWTVQHDGGGTAVYLVRLVPDGRGSTRFMVQRETSTAAAGQ